MGAEAGHCGATRWGCPGAGVGDKETRRARNEALIFFACAILCPPRFPGGSFIRLLGLLRDLNLRSFTRDANEAAEANEARDGLAGSGGAGAQSCLQTCWDSVETESSLKFIVRHILVLSQENKNPSRNDHKHAHNLRWLPWLNEEQTTHICVEGTSTNAC